MRDRPLPQDPPSRWTPERLRTWRLGLGMTQRDLAPFIGGRWQTIGDWERYSGPLSTRVSRLLDMLSAPNGPVDRHLRAKHAAAMKYGSGGTGETRGRHGADDSQTVAAD